MQTIRSALLAFQEIDGVQLQLVGHGHHLLLGDGRDPLGQGLGLLLQAGRGLAQPEVLQAALGVETVEIAFDAMAGLAQALRESLDMERLWRIMGLPSLLN